MDISPSIPYWPNQPIPWKRCGAGSQPQHRDAPLASQRSEAAFGARLQDLARPEVRGEARRYRGPVHVPAEHALVLCCDEKIQVQALDRTQPSLDCR
jgi:hypothetical protein